MRATSIGFSDYPKTYHGWDWGAREILFFDPSRLAKTASPKSFKKKTQDSKWTKVLVLGTFLPWKLERYIRHSSYPGNHI